jgi:hypothetical protein
MGPSEPTRRRVTTDGSSVRISREVFERLSALKRQLSVSEGVDMSPDTTIEWMLNRIDAADLP